jgi:hypothetical protein
LYGIGQYSEAVPALNQVLHSGQIQHPDEAFVYLGRSKIALNDIDGARTSFANLKAVPNLSHRLLRLWDLYAETLSQ